MRKGIQDGLWEKKTGDPGDGGVGVGVKRPVDDYKE